MYGKSIVPPFARTERDLVRAAQAGNPRAVEYLITTHEPVCKLIGSQMRKLDRSGKHHDEMRAVANLALLEALPKFDLARGVKCTTFVFQHVRGAMLKAMFPGQRSPQDEAKPTIRLVGLDAPVGDDTDDDRGWERELFARDTEYGIDPGYARALTTDRDAAVRAFVASLGDGQRGIVIDLFWHSQTHLEIATDRGVSRPAISRALARAYQHGRVELAAHEAALAA